MIDARLTAHFALDELTFSQTATRLGIDNAPHSTAVLGRLHVLAQGLERVRSILGDHPLRVSSGYRCPALNTAVGGAPNSAHVLGLAADFTCQELGSPLDVCRTLAASVLDYDELIFEGAWCHVAFAPVGRFHVRRALTAHFAAGHPTTYTEGIG